MKRLSLTFEAGLLIGLGHEVLVTAGLVVEAAMRQDVVRGMCDMCRMVYDQQVQC